MEATPSVHFNFEDTSAKVWKPFMVAHALAARAL